MRLATTLTIGLVLLVAYAPASSAATGSEPVQKAFTQCGDYPADFTYGLRTEGVPCPRGKNVSERWYRNAVRRDFPRVVRFGSWRCTSENYGDGVNVKCKDGSKEVRFAMGG